MNGPEGLPRFRYHPEPVSTGSVEPSGATCAACERARGYVYVGPVYSEEELGGRLCPWCMDDGTAHESFDAEFVGPADVGRGYEMTWDDVSEAVVEEVTRRTPGFASWQGEHWFTHCGDAAAFLGPMGQEGLEDYGPRAVGATADETGCEGEELESYPRALDKNHGPMAYLFQCRHCGKLGGYSDTH